MSILLSKDKGVNPVMGICPRCGKENGEILLVGRSHKYICSNCGGTIVGKQPKECPHCGASWDFFDKGEFEGSREKLPSSLCKECQSIIDTCKKEMELGGVPWKCEDCHSEGVIKHDSEFAINFRKENPEVGVLFNKKNCPVCRNRDKDASSVTP